MERVRHLSTQELVQIQERTKTIAVIGASADETKTANATRTGLPQALREALEAAHAKAVSNPARLVNWCRGAA